ncbi:hypothetical protein I6G82_17460 [Lysinibacillus macroides]|nr:hypothetical protein [Lysinibacillus macroides]QPR67024.1 hypothetical protein I6G82_17460 [Lysinibacillus macroides]
MYKTKQQKWWRCSLNTFLATTLVASSLSFVGAPQAKADTEYTAGVYPGE